MDARIIPNYMDNILNQDEYSSFKELGNEMTFYSNINYLKDDIFEENKQKKAFEKYINQDKEEEKKTQLLHFLTIQKSSIQDNNGLPFIDFSDENFQSLQDVVYDQTNCLIHNQNRQFYGNFDFTDQLTQIDYQLTKRIGNLSFDERQQKLNRYRNKRELRNWEKKISYDCRKRVADGRLRIKGRFVTRDQAIDLLQNEYSAEEAQKKSTNELRRLLSNKMMKND